MRLFWLTAICLLVSGEALAQEPPYENRLPAEPPYYRVRYPASTEPGELAFPVSYTVWIPPGTQTLRGVIVHQHGCGEGSCKSGQTGAYDLHWQALARKHSCALLGPSYEQPEKANCQLWCDPRNGSDAAFQKALQELGTQSGHAELSSVPWAIWGHSGGGHWAGGMALLHPDRVVAAWLRSGVPPLTEVADKPKPYSIPEAVYGVPLLCNLGAKEGVTEKSGRFAGVWPNVDLFFTTLRAKGALVGVAIDPLSSHDCGNQRYLAIPWFDACLILRLPEKNGEPLRMISASSGWLVPQAVSSSEAVPVPQKEFDGVLEESTWLPTQAIATAWREYVRDTAVSDATPPPAPTELRVAGNELSWQCEADLESGLAGFIVERDGQQIAKIPPDPRNPFGRPVFQNLSYSDTPTQPLVEMRFTDNTAGPAGKHTYRVIAVNTAGLQSSP